MIADRVEKRSDDTRSKVAGIAEPVCTPESAEATVAVPMASIASTWRL